MNKNPHSMQSKIKGCMGLMVLLVMVFVGGQALAEIIPGVPASRIMDVLAPKGMQTTAIKETGVLTITVDDDATDWNQALVYDGDLRAVEVIAGIVPPSNATGYMTENGLPFDTDSDAMATFDTNENNGNFNPELLEFMPCTAPQMVAQYVTEKQIVSTISSDHMYLYVRWYDAQNQPILTEKMRIVVKHLNPQSRYAVPEMLNEEFVTANATFLPEIRSIVTNSEVTYSFTGEPASLQQDAYISTKIKAPEGAVFCNQMDMMMGAFPFEIVDGYVELQSYYTEQKFVSVDGLWQSTAVLRTGAWRENYALEWLDANENVIECNMAVVYMNMLEKEPWPNYVTDTQGVSWSAVPEDRLHVSKGEALSQVSTTYNDGILKYSYQDVLSSAEGMELATVDISVTPPTGASQYALISGGGSGKLGVMGDWELDSIYAQLKNSAQTQWQSGAVSVWNYPIFEKLEAPDGKVSIYRSTIPNDPDECQVFLIGWYNEDSELMGVEYYSVLSDDFVMTAQTDTYEEETSVPQQNEYPVVVEKNGKLRNCKLIVMQYPQYGKNGIHYELHLVDERGKLMDLKQNMVLYLPYPKGHGQQQGWAYTLQHYDLDFKHCTIIPLTQTPKGLRCETSSFSPFVLSWEDEPASIPVPVIDPPKTGDSATPLLWIGEMALALLGIGFLVRSKWKKKNV